MGGKGSGGRRPGAGRPYQVSETGRMVICEIIAEREGTPKELAEVYGVGVSTVQRYARGWLPPRPPHPPETREHVLKLRKRGLTLRAVASEAQVPLRTVRTWLAKAQT